MDVRVSYAVRLQEIVTVPHHEVQLDVAMDGQEDLQDKGSEYQDHQKGLIQGKKGKDTQKLILQQTEESTCSSDSDLEDQGS